MPYNTQTTRSNVDLLIPEPIQREIINGVAAESAMLTMCRRLPNMSSSTERMPIIASLPTGYFVAEPSGAGLETTDTKQTSNVTWTHKTLTAEEIAVLLPIHENVIDDANYDIWAEVRPKVVEAFGVVIDAAMVIGTNKPASWPTAMLTAANTASNSFSLGYGADFADDVNHLMELVEADGYMVNGFLAPVATKARLRGLRGTDGQFIFTPSLTQDAPDMLYGAPIRYSRNGSFTAANLHLLGGAFQEMVYSIRQDITVKVLTEATIYDPATNAPQYALAQQDMIALRVKMRLGFQLPNPINRLQAVEANRYPFAVIVP